jgi:AcrR family transcriptional regulator
LIHDEEKISMSCFRRVPYAKPRNLARDHSLNLMAITLQPGQHLLSAAVTAASRLAAETGEPPRLKAVAKALGIKKETLKAFIPNRNYLLGAMADTALLRLLHMITDQICRCSSSSPVFQLEAVANAYIDWARLYPYEFRLIGQMPAALFEANPRLLQYEQSIHDLVFKIFQRARDEGYLDPEEDLTMLRAISHTYLYGVITKMMLGDLARWTPGLSDHDAARAAIRLFNEKWFKAAPYPSDAPSTKEA